MSATHGNDNDISDNASANCITKARLVLVLFWLKANLLNVYLTHLLSYVLFLECGI